MEAQLKKCYISLLAPAILGFIAAILARRFSAIDLEAVKSLQRFTAPVLFALSFAFGAAFPLLFRTLFVHKNRHEKRISEAALLQFERNTLYLAMITPYIALVAFFLEIPRFHLAGALLASFYAVYYFYPSHKRIQYEKRIFRAK
ncbi:MAG: hypothetical protein WAL98_03605 [Desulfatiglandaceae bacterium]